MATKTKPTTHIVIFDVEPEDWNMKGSLFCSVWSLCRNSAASCWQTPWWWPGLGTERSPLSLCIWGWHRLMAWPRHHVPLMSGFPMLHEARTADTGQPMRGGYCHSGPMRRGLGAFGGSISLTVHSGRSSTSYFKACRTLACSAHMISSLLMYKCIHHCSTEIEEWRVQR